MATTTTTDRPRRTEQELNIQRKLVHILWLTKNADTLPESIEERRELFEADKSDYSHEAATLVLRLKNSGLKIVEHQA
jgi:hypothetical protein